MSQQVLNANAESFVEKILTADPSKVQDLTYKTVKSYPNVSKSSRVINPFTTFNGDFSNNTDVFQISQSDMLNLLRLKFTCTASAAIAANSVLKNSYVAENLINTITLKMNGQPLSTLSGAAIKSHYQDCQESVQLNHYRYALPLDGTTEKPFTDAVEPTEFVCYLGIPSSFLVDAHRNFNLKETDIMSLEILYNSTAGAGFPAAFTKMDATLSVYKWLADEATMKMIREVDYSSNQYRLGWSTYTEPKVLDSLTSITYTCQAKYANFKLYPMIYRTLTTGAVYGCPQVEILKVTIQLGDEYYLYDYTRSMVNYENAAKGASSCMKIANVNAVPTLQYNDTKCPCIEFSLGCKSDSNTGIAAFKNLGNPIITLTYNATVGAAGEYTAFFVHKFWQILESDPSQKVIFTKVQT